MANKRLIVKSYRTQVGVLGNARKFGQGVYLLDSNDTSKYYGAFGVFSGFSDEAEASCLALLAEMIEPHMDVYLGGELSKPKAFLKRLIGEFLKALEERGLVDAGSTRFSFAIVLVKDGAIYIGRINECPVFYLKDRKLRHIFRAPKSRGAGSVQVEGFALSNGDKVVLSNESMVKNLTKLEVRNVLLTEDDLDLACNRIDLLAGKYEETVSPRLMIIDLRVNRETTQSAFSRRNVALLGAVALVFLMFFLWGDVKRLAGSSPMAVVLKKNKGWTERFKEKVEATINAPTYKTELVYDKLYVPYDVAIAKDGVIYVVDDREEKIVRYNPASGFADKIGTKVKLRFPTGIDVTDDRIYVTDFSVNKVFIFKKDGTYAGKIPDDRSIMVRLQNPKSVKAAGDGKVVYVCDRGNNRVLRFDAEGTYANDGTIRMPSGFRQPNGLTVTEGGIIYLTLKGSGQIAKISSRSIVTDFMIFKDDASGSKTVSLAKPSGIAVDRKGYVYVADTDNQRIVVTNQMGKLVEIIDGDMLPDLKNFYPLSVKLGPRGDYVYAVLSSRYKYDARYKSKCKGKIWKIKI